MESVPQAKPVIATVSVYISKVRETLIWATPFIQLGIFITLIVVCYRLREVERSVDYANPEYELGEIKSELQALNERFNR